MKESVVYGWKGLFSGVLGSRICGGMGVEGWRIVASLRKKFALLLEYQMVGFLFLYIDEGIEQIK